MAVLTGVKAGTGHEAGEGRLSWPIFLLTLAAVTSSSLSALSLYQMMALRAEVEGLRAEVGRRREEGQEVNPGGQSENISSSQETIHQRPAFTLIRRRRMVDGAETLVSQPCLQLLANNSRKTFRKEFDLEPHTGIPWQAGLRRGSALETDGDSILVREEGFFFVYSQVYYMDSTFAMGHVVIRRKRNVVGDEPQYVILFRCIQTMNPVYPYNTCYTGGIVKLEVGDHLELLIPRSTATVSLDGDATFLGAVKLA
ncbi:tumor necrosis factor ligand superfamily member 13B [Hippoglossus hippoglossus]|uniref:tumor necrosis factor ligand superfamily member 13B n=1 Tax=Hippoglossus hippoglossus TaxID=8267 RepID=UPI00148DFB49|nr:tumor necrosis factor ligand superfamily member 13B [Hippoglossus hippoglossus]XP_035030847.1 tumor necrosis factor ligand superfamily member 13B isoform X2 [Hippoglossus stenolepis]